MSKAKLKKVLLAEYDHLEDLIEESASTQMWALADWLVTNVPNNGHGGDRTQAASGPLALSDIAARGRRGERWLQRMRRVAEVTQADRLPNVGVRVYQAALEAHGWDLAAANASIAKKGARLRDQAGPMESVEALKRQIAARPPSERAAIVTDILRQDPEAMAKATATDTAYPAALATASSWVGAETERGNDERTRVREQITEDEMRARKLQVDLRHGNYGDAERRLGEFDDLDAARPVLEKHRDHLTQVMDWLTAWIDGKVTDEKLEEWLR